MTHAERRAIREKHQPKPWSKDYCKECGVRSTYPCDTIRVLDELEMWVKE